MTQDKKSPGKPPRNPDTIRFSIDAYLTRSQIEWFESQGKTKSGTLTAMIERGMANDNAIDNAKVSIEINGIVRVYQPIELII